jgi:hypothetical protein
MVARASTTTIGLPPQYDEYTIIPCSREHTIREEGSGRRRRRRLCWRRHDDDDDRGERSVMVMAMDSPREDFIIPVGSDMSSRWCNATMVLMMEGYGHLLVCFARGYCRLLSVIGSHCRIDSNLRNLRVATRPGARASIHHALLRWIFFSRPPPA